MRNVFDQYSQPENRVTHALMTALNEDRALLAAFLREIANLKPPKPAKDLSILEQTFPGQPEPPEDAEQRSGIPDAWITSDNDWCLLLENKVLDAVTADQMRRHISVAKRLGFEEPHALVLTVRKPLDSLPQFIPVIEWRTLYRWLINKSPNSAWARRVYQYLEIMEARLIDQQQLVTGTLTSFNGFNFGQDVPYNYGEAKRVLNLATSELRQHEALIRDLQMSPTRLGRPAITGQDADRVWDFLQIEAAEESKAFTDCPHLTLGITDRQVEAMITVPNGIRRAYRRNLLDLGQAGFRNLLREILHRMEPLLIACPGAEPRCSAVQRRYPSQRSVPFVDARLEFDLRTGFDDIGPPKTQPQWIDVLYNCLTNNNSNYQFQVGVWFPYRTCPSIRTAVALEFIADAWLACRPLVEVMLDGQSD